MTDIPGALTIFEESLRLFEQCIEPLATESGAA